LGQVAGYVVGCFFGDGGLDTAGRFLCADLGERAGFFCAAGGLSG
jgi:hypothetical protein